ncbi:MAG TPA: hypothetical protein P5528_13820 [Steroidobacteraceae bacterium]|nr:hypothetical protein [Steroidobacteraceae bacterium]HRX90515.1 hypothetical protein [Steroidobacteraceae bacterium]
MADMTETMVERRIGELELRYSIVNEQIARLRAELAALGDLQNGSTAEANKLRAQIEKLKNENKRTAAALDSLAEGDAA